MKAIIPPVFTGDNFTIHYVQKQKNGWEVTASISGKLHTFRVLGPEENILRAVGKANSSPFELFLFKRNLRS